MDQEKDEEKLERVEAHLDDRRRDSRLRRARHRRRRLEHGHRHRQRGEVVSQSVQARRRCRVSGTSPEFLPRRVCPLCGLGSGLPLRYGASDRILRSGSSCCLIARQPDSKLSRLNAGGATRLARLLLARVGRE